MARKTLAVWIVLLGLGMGLLSSVLFYQKAVGVSFPLFILTAVVVMLAASRPAQTPVNWRNLWPLVPLLFFAGMVAIRADTIGGVLNIGAALALGGLALHYLPVRHALDEAPLEEHIAGTLEAMIYATFAAIAEVVHSVGWLRERSWQGRTVIAVVRGLAIALPVIVVFTVLLGSADVVFAGFVQDAWNLLAFSPDDGLVDQVFISLSVGWLATGALAYGLARRPPQSRTVTVPDTEVDEELDAHFVLGDEQPVPMESVEVSAPAKRKTRPLIRLGMIETGIVLGLVDVLFGVFVLVQMAYFFGGADFITERGLTYAQYARRGFFELVAVSVLTLGLVLWLNHSTLRSNRRQNILFTALSVIVVALTSIMLISASQRMFLYEEVYGFTHLRVLTHVFMLWLGVLFVFFLLSLFNLKPRIFTLGLLLTSVGYLATVNVMNVDLYIAERNIDRFYQGYALDMGFLWRLSADAVPAVVRLYEENKTNSEVQQWAGQWLAYQVDQLDRLNDETVFSFNLARQEARAQLETIRSELPVYDPYFYWSSERDYWDIYAETPEPVTR